MRAMMPGKHPNQPVAWSNQLLTLYHGTIDTYVAAILAGVNVNLGRTGTDFGRGFYTTTVRRQARLWDWQLAQRLGRRGGSNHGRSISGGWYDIVVGPVAASWIDPQARNEFWKVVQECLIELHGLKRLDALQRSQDLRTKIEAPPPGLSSELFYHAEPFQVACDLAGAQLDLSQYRAQYDAILSRHHW